MHAFPAFRKQSQEDFKCKPLPGYIASPSLIKHHGNKSNNNSNNIGKSIRQLTELVFNNKCQCDKGSVPSPKLTEVTEGNTEAVCFPSGASDATKDGKPASL